MAENIILDESKYRDRRSLRMKEYGFNAVISKNVPARLHTFFEKKKYTLRTNALGFIENGNGISSTNRICVMGDSFSECFFMEEKDRFVSVCERELHDRGHDVELLNCSMTGMNIFHAVFVMLAKVLPLGVSKVIYITSNSDYQSSRMNDGDFFTHDKVYSIFNEEKEISERNKPVYTNYNRLLNTLYSICKLAKIELIFALRPFESTDKRRQINVVTERFLLRKNIKCIDLRSFYCEKCYYDNTHLTNKSSILFGKYFSNILHDILINEAKDQYTPFKIRNNPFIFNGFFPSRVLKLKERPAMVRVVKRTLGTADEAYWGDATFFLNTDEYSFSDNANGIYTRDKIVVIGDSFIECFFMAPEERLLSVAERELRDSYHCKKELLNCSMGGANILHSIFTFLAKIAFMESSIVLYSPSINDYKCLCIPGTFYTNHKNLSIFEMDSIIRDKVRPQYDIYSLYIRIFYSICNIFGHKLVFVLRPFHGGGSVDMLNKTAISFCHKKNIEFIDLRKFSEEEVEKMHYDRGHLLPEGARILGKLLAKNLYEQGLVTA